MRDSKHKRGEEPGQPGETAKQRRRQQEQKEKSEQKKLLRTAITVAAAVLVVTLLTGMVTAGVFTRLFTAATLGGHKLSASMFSFFYWDAYQDFVDEDPMMSAQVFDEGVSLSQQIYSEEDGTTYADYFISEAAIAAAETLRLYDAAVAAGYVLPEEEEAALAELRATLDEIVQTSADYRNADAYLRAIYGRGVTVDEYIEYTRICLTAACYADDYKEALTYSADELVETYNENPLDFDTVSYKIFYSSVIIGENEDGTAKADMEQSEANAKSMAEQSRGDIERFDEMAVELAAESRKASYSDPSFTLRQDYTVSDANDMLTDWLIDPARQYGDTTYVYADERGYYVAFFIDYSTNDYDLARLNTISVTASADAGNEDDPDGRKASYEEAQSLLVEMESGGFSEDTFATLMSNAAVYPNYVPGILGDEVDAWCYDEPRSEGDSAILETDTGYLVVQYDGKGDYYRDYLVAEHLREKEADAWYEAIIAGEPAQLHGLGLFFMSK